MSGNPILRRHRLHHIPELELGESILRSRYERGCSMSRCSGYCCRDGVLAGIEERERIRQHAELVRCCMDEHQERDEARWFGEEIDDPDFPSGRAVDTRVHRGNCVFLDGEARCVLQKAETRGGLAAGTLKPFFCRAFPVCIEYGVLTVDDEHCPDESRCCGPVAQGSLTIFDICADELEFVLGAEGLRELRQLTDDEPPPG